MSTAQKLLLNVAAQLALAVVVAVSSFHVWKAWPLLGVLLAGLFAFQLLMTGRSIKRVWKFFG